MHEREGKKNRGSVGDLKEDRGSYQQDVTLCTCAKLTILILGPPHLARSETDEPKH
jgi:hypothetical protein